MSLAPGARLGPYEIVGQIGAGGMGEVHRARDTKLQRDVAVKILPEEVAADPERMSRLEREARVLAALNHPNIAAHPVSTAGVFTAGQPTILIRDVGIAAPYSSATPDHSRILIRVSPDAAEDKGEIRLLFNWDEALKQERQ